MKEGDVSQIASVKCSEATEDVEKLPPGIYTENVNLASGTYTINYVLQAVLANLASLYLKVNVIIIYLV